MDVLTEIGLVLGEVIPITADKTWELLWKTDKLRFRADLAYAEATESLAKRRLQVLLPKDTGITELDRTTTQNAGSAEETSKVERLSYARDLLASRVGLLRDYVATLHTTDKEDLQ